MVHNAFYFKEGIRRIAVKYYEKDYVLSMMV